MHDEAVVRGCQVSLGEWGVVQGSKAIKPSREQKGAPEVLAGAKAYSFTIDMWSVGYIMAEMMLKEVLLKGVVKIEQLRIIYTSFGIGCAKPYDNQLLCRFLAANAFGGCPMLTQLGFDLLNMLLCFDLDKRITSDESLNHG
ncbi:Cyclin-dependent kinase G-2 [Sesamum alatum]|uniref:Cyclin-dependent kinase G-2 n=1 Tax=Sesamum alatum TaxID=300844 RepID=A0AAE1Y2Z9_9LAMI|nr:Cyclin-dependent kinase G-2 [Sesamum alatum]